MSYKFIKKYIQTNFQSVYKEYEKYFKIVSYNKTGLIRRIKNPNFISVHKNYWFSLIEILIAVSIMTLTVFWILSMVASGVKQSSLLEQNKDIYDIAKNSKECLEYIWYNTLSWVTSTQSINFWNDNNWCFTGAYDSNLNFSWIILQSYTEDETKKTWINEYWSYFLKSSWTTNYVIIDNYVNDWKITYTLKYKIFK